MNRHHTRALAALALLLIVVAFSGELHAQLQRPAWQERQWLRKRPLIADIVVEGNSAVKDGKVRDWMESRTAGFWAPVGLSSRPRVNQATLQRDENSIATEYRRLGYWGVRVSMVAEPLKAEQEARLHVQIEEGPRSYWGDVRVMGDDSELVGRLSRRAAELKRGAPADSVAFAITRALMLADCANRAHPAALINSSVTRRGDTLDAVYNLDAGPRVIIGDLRVEGLSRTRESVVRRMLRIDGMHEFSRKQIDERQQDVYASGLFSLVRLEPVYADSNGSAETRTADLMLRVIERKPSFIGFRTGAGQDVTRDLTWDYALEWGSRNWFGTARKWTLSAQSSFVVITEWRVLHNQFSAQYVEPWPFGIRLPTTLELSFEPRLRSVIQDYRVERISGELSVSRKSRSRHLQWTSGLIIDRVDISDVPSEAEDEILKEEGISVRRRWTVSIDRDTRPNLFVPTNGAHTHIDFQFVGGPLGGADDFYKVDFSWARYQVISPPSVLATRLRIAWANLHSGGTSIPTLDRYYLGGANSIRGYSENTVGPVDTLGSAIGGEVVTLLNLEMRSPFNDHWWFTLFGDVGNNWSNFHDVQLDMMLLSVGVGLEYIAPVGPLRLDYARRVLHPGHPKSDRVHLSILFAF